MEEALTLILLVVAGVLFTLAMLPRFASWAIQFIAAGAFALVLMMLVERL